jgi:hypothetical protein
MSKFHINFVIWHVSRAVAQNTGKYRNIFFKEAFNMAYKPNFSGILVSSLFLTFEILPLKNDIFLA